MEPLTIGIIGCGNICGAYLKAVPGFDTLRIKAIADITPAVAEARADEFGVPAVEVDALLADPEIEAVVNLTTPQSHVPVALKILAAGKHAYSEKPLAVSTEEANRLRKAADGLRVGCAPDTFLGGGQQTARKLLDDGAIGRPLSGTAFMMLRGHERWHPNPDFYYRPGGGPMLDMGPYYLTALVNLLGPVRRVCSMTTAGLPSRVIASGPRQGEVIPVETDTHIAALLEFQSGAIITIVTSFDVWKHDHRPLELYGEAGSMRIPDPNTFGGPVFLARERGDWEEVPLTHGFGDGNYRSIGVADLAHAIRAGRPHRASMELAFHVLEVMEACLKSSDDDRFIDIESWCERPAALPTGLAPGRLDD